MEAPRKKQRAIISERVDPTKPASRVIDKFGGLTRFCGLSGYATSTAHSWTLRGYIPAHRKGVSIHAHILSVAREHSIDLDPSDFVDQSAPVAVAAHG